MYCLVIEYTGVMPMEMFVSCVVDLSALVGTLLVVIPVCSVPGSFFFLSTRPWGLESFHPGSSHAP